MVAIIVPLAITASPSNPPAIAEFAPEAQQQIKDAPKQQGSSLGNGPLGEGLGALASPSPLAALLTPNANPTPLISVRHCIGAGGSLTQIEDPQSPPCVPFFNGDNGGSTWKGVTGSEITVATAGGDPPSRFEVALINFFNHRFEFYGRKLKLVHYAPSDACSDAAGVICGQPSTPSVMQADAQLVDEKLHAFADLGYREAGFGSTFSFYDALAARRILSVQLNLTEEPRSDQAHLTQYAPTSGISSRRLTKYNAIWSIWSAMCWPGRSRRGPGRRSVRRPRPGCLAWSTLSIQTGGRRSAPRR